MSIFNSFAALASGGAEIETGTFVGSGEMIKTVTFSDAHTKAPAIAFVYCTSTASSNTALFEVLVRGAALEEAFWTGDGIRARLYGRGATVTPTGESLTASSINDVLTSTKARFTAYSSGYSFRSNYGFRWYAIWL